MLKLRLATAFCATLLCAASSATSFPDRAVTLIVPQSAGSGGDVVARLLSDKIAQNLGQSVIVDNKPGANGVVAMSSVAKARADGYTILLTGVSQMSFNPHLYATLPYDPAKDFTYVAPVVDTPFVLIASKNSGFKTLEDFISTARKQPGDVTFSSAGKGNSTHLATEMAASQANITLQHIPYKGSAPALNAVMSGEVDVMTSVLGTALPQITAGAVVPLAVLAGERATDLPDVPTLKESGLKAPPMPGWYAIVGPAGLEPDVVQRLNTAIQSALADPVIDQRLRKLYFVPMQGSAQEMMERAERDSKVWGAFIAKAGLKVD